MLLDGENFCNVEGEGGTDVANYGGNVMDDDSGSIRFVRIAEGGKSIGVGNEINGLTLQGVGHGTTVEYVQVHNNLDDGIEWFGGTVNAKYVVLTNNDDDDIDFDEGFQGNIQYGIIVKHQTRQDPLGSNDPRGIEANSSDGDFVPQTNAALANITIIGGPVSSEEPGMRLRGSVSASIYNTAVNNFDFGCIRIDNSDVMVADPEDARSKVALTNVLTDCMGGIYTHEVPTAPETPENVIADAFALDAAFALVSEEADVVAPMITAVDNGSEFVFDQTDYVGAVAPGTAPAAAWWAGWTITDTLDEAIANNAAE